MHEKNIVLTGLRGSGKSKIGKILSEKLSINFVDLDEEIEKSAGKTIKEIVAKEGWQAFRLLEKAATEKIAALKKTVIATGGGCIIDPENEKILKSNGIIVYLDANPLDCAGHIANSKKRPPLTDKKSLEEEMLHLHKERNGRYKESAEIIFKRSDDVEKDAEKLQNLLSRLLQR